MCLNGIEPYNIMVITEFEEGSLMGHNMRTLNLYKISAAQFRRLLGMSVHVSVMGIALLSILGAMGAGH